MATAAMSPPMTMSRVMMRHTNDDQGVAEKADEQNPKEDPDHAALSPEEGNAAQDDGRDGVDFDPCPRSG